jgi:four helix bundle protein
MSLTHAKLDVYQAALQLARGCAQVRESVPRMNRDLIDQLTRASQSVVLNIAEGVGRFRPLDKRKFYLTALGSAHECAAILDLFRAFGQLDDEGHTTLSAHATRVIEMLTKLAAAMERRAEGGDWK